MRAHLYYSQQRRSAYDTNKPIISACEHIYNIVNSVDTDQQTTQINQ